MNRSMCEEVCGVLGRVQRAGIIGGVGGQGGVGECVPQQAAASDFHWPK